MEKVFEAVKGHPLFRGIAAEAFCSMLACVQGRVQAYKKGEAILLAGSRVDTVGLLLSGTAQVLREDENGKQNLMAELGQGELFGEVFACLETPHRPVTVLASHACEVLHLQYRKVITVCPSACVFHQQLVENMLSLMAQKTLLLHQKIEILSKRTTRERLLCYFDLYRKGQRSFTLSLRREELAAYLCVERSAMSAELSRMQQDGLILVQKNNITRLA